MFLTLCTAIWVNLIPKSRQQYTFLIFNVPFQLLHAKRKNLKLLCGNKPKISNRLYYLHT